MRWTALRMGLVLVFGLALLTVALNVRSTRLGYRLGVIMHRQDEQAALIRARRVACRELSNTSELIAYLTEHGIPPASLNRWALAPEIDAVAMERP